VLIDERKICGILIEGAGGGARSRAFDPRDRRPISIIKTFPVIWPTRRRRSHRTLAEEWNVDDFRDHLLIKIARWYEAGRMAPRT
jgi:hypothetical protein